MVDKSCYFEPQRLNLQIIWQFIPMFDRWISEFAVEKTVNNEVRLYKENIASSGIGHMGTCWTCKVTFTGTLMSMAWQYTKHGGLDVRSNLIRLKIIKTKEIFSWTAGIGSYRPTFSSWCVQTSLPIGAIKSKSYSSPFQNLLAPLVKTSFRSKNSTFWKLMWQ